MVSKPASVAAPAISSPAANLLDQLLAAIQQPAEPHIAVVIERVDAAYSVRSVDVEIRPAPIIQNRLDLARKALIKAEIGGDETAAKEAAKRVSDLEKELSSGAMKLQALNELRDERREAVAVEHGELGETVSQYRERVKSAADALDAEAKRLKAAAWAAHKAVDTGEQVYDAYGASVKTPAEDNAIRETRDLFPEAWAKALFRWRTVQEWLCRR